MKIFKKNSENLSVETPYGPVNVETNKRKDNEIFYINRHGNNSKIPPHMIKYRANIQTFSSCHVDCILSIYSVGSMSKQIKKGDIVIPHDFIAFTRSRYSTFFYDSRIHVNLIDPFCPHLRKILIKKCSKEGIYFHSEGVYLTTEGPRLETVSEVKIFSKFADIVGMTLATECILAREKAICFATICIVVNMAAGLQDNLHIEDMRKYFKKKESIIANIIVSTIDSTTDNYKCSYKNYIDEAKA